MTAGRPAPLSAPRLRAVAGALALVVAVIGCGKRTAPKPASPAPAAPAPAAAVDAPAPTSPTSADDKARAAAAAETEGYMARRKQRPAVIGGCEESCGTPEKAVALLFERLQAPDRLEALHGLFDWSLLVVDGEDRGGPWAEMWGSTVAQPAREAEIAAWLKEWSAFVDDVASPEDLVRSRVNGLWIKPFAGRTDVWEVTWRHPKLRTPRGEDVWRFDLTRRGWEWLISRVDHSPSKTPRRGPPPPGSAAPGRL